MESTLWTGRWTIGIVILIQLMAFDEIGATTTIFSTIIAGICSLLSAKCKSSLNHLQMPYVRATHKYDFYLLFLAIWMDILALLTACAALARTLSTCLDAMTGGLARVYILGRNSSANEPWPDVLGVCVVFLITGMFMLGLENTKIFRILMVSSVLGICGLLTCISALRGNFKAWEMKNLLPTGYFGLLTGSALNIFTYPSDFQMSSNENRKTLYGFCIVLCVCLSNVLIGGCLSTIIKYDPTKEFVAVPILNLLDYQDFHNAIPAIACLLVLACSGAYLELFPEMFHLFVRLSTSEWKILSRQIGYENSDSGSPVLAIFIGGSICAMLAFACPLEILIHILAASTLCSGILRAFYLLYSPFRPKYMSSSNNKNDATLAYSRLETEPQICDSINNSICTINDGNNNNNNIGNSSSTHRSAWSLNKTKSLHSVLSKSTLRLMKNKRNEELEREWLLLGEPQSPRITSNENDPEAMMNMATTTMTSSTSSSAMINGAGNDTINNIECGILSNEECRNSSIPDTDTECIVRPEQSDTDDSSTDIDAVVDEYRQKVKVSTAGPMDKTIRVPTVGTWSFTIICIGIEIFMMILLIVGFIISSLAMIIIGIIVILLTSIIMLFIPKYNYTATSPSVVCCTITLLFEIILLLTTITNAWGGILFWIISGTIIFMRCDRWFNHLCLERPHSSSQLLIQNVTTNVPSIRISQSLNCIGNTGSNTTRLINNGNFLHQHHNHHLHHHHHHNHHR